MMRRTDITRREVGPATDIRDVMLCLARHVLAQELNDYRAAVAELMAWESGEVTAKTRRGSLKAARRDAAKAGRRMEAALRLVDLVRESCRHLDASGQPVPTAPDASQSPQDARTATKAPEMTSDTGATESAVLTSEMSGGSYEVGGILRDAATGLPVCRTCAGLMQEPRNGYCGPSCQIFAQAVGEG